MGITEWDEYFIHQIPKSIDQVETDDPYAYDRMFWACHNIDGTLHLKAGLGSYPNVNVMDGFVTVRHKNIERNIRISRHLEAGPKTDRTSLKVGPLSYRILQPLKRWSIELVENDYGIACSLEFEGRHYPSHYPILQAKGWMDHYDQLGRYKGSITFEGKKYSADGFLGTRDRSWGIRRPCLADNFEIYWWLHAHFSDFCMNLVNLEYVDKIFRLRFGGIHYDDGRVIPVDDMYHRIDFVPGSKVWKYRKIQLLLKDTNGKERHLTAKPISPPCYMAGGGYDDWYGVDRGAFHIEGERWDVNKIGETDPRRFIWVQRDFEFDLDGEHGIGFAETSIGRPGRWKYKPTF